MLGKGTGTNGFMVFTLNTVRSFISAKSCSIFTYETSGTVVRFAPDHISFNTPTAVETIYKSRRSNLIKSDWYQTVRDSAGGFESTFTAREPSRHAIKRRLLSHAFSDKALKNYEPRICSLVDSWIECLQTEAENGDGCVDLGKWCNYLIFDILGDLGYGQSFGLTSNKEDRSIVGLVPKATAGWTAVS
jgi:cytochrome P450